MLSSIAPVERVLEQPSGHARRRGDGEGPSEAHVPSSRRASTKASFVRARSRLALTWSAAMAPDAPVSRYSAVATTSPERLRPCWHVTRTRLSFAYAASDDPRGVSRPREVFARRIASVVESRVDDLDPARKERLRGLMLHRAAYSPIYAAERERMAWRILHELARDARKIAELLAPKGD